MPIFNIQNGKELLVQRLKRLSAYIFTYLRTFTELLSSHSNHYSRHFEPFLSYPSGIINNYECNAKLRKGILPVNTTLSAFHHIYSNKSLALFIHIFRTFVLLHTLSNIDLPEATFRMPQLMY